MPPLMLERDEAVAVAVSLSSTATSTLSGAATQRGGRWTSWNSSYCRCGGKSGRCCR
ncbi:hypothetical protein BH24ACT5_BH24ACT5_16760 [soil metagenome]